MNKGYKFKKDDLKFWRSQTDDLKNKAKTVDVDSYEEDTADDMFEPQPSSDELLNFRKVQKESLTTLPDLKVDENSAGLDGNTNKKFRAGKMPIEGKLDMHGMIQDVAFDALISFINSSFDNGKRCLIVVTGKGFLAKNGGILKKALPIWINNEEIRSKILSFCQARPTDGGSGAFYILLKKKGK